MKIWIDSKGQTVYAKGSRKNKALGLTREEFKSVKDMISGTVTRADGKIFYLPFKEKDAMKENPRWVANKIQFPRLICELDMVGAITPQVMDALCESMDLTEDDIVELFDRAMKEWERIKAQC